MDDEGEWVNVSLAAGTLMMLHDGSYNENLDPNKSAAAYVVMCTKSKKQLSGSVVEDSEHASNYRAELLGALCCLLIVKAAQDSGTRAGSCTGYCDNKGVVLHCKRAKTWDKVRAKQSQDDLIRLCREIMQGLELRVRYKHVRSHMD